MPLSAEQQEEIKKMLEKAKKAKEEQEDGNNQEAHDAIAAAQAAITWLLGSTPTLGGTASTFPTGERIGYYQVQNVSRAEHADSLADTELYDEIGADVRSCQWLCTKIDGMIP
jgi:hypothetical protein